MFLVTFPIVLYMCMKVSFPFLSLPLPSVGSQPLEVSASQEGLTSVLVSWTPPQPLGQTIGYQIYYTGPTSGNVSVDNVDSSSQVVTGLMNGELYQFFVAGRSEHLESEPLATGSGDIGLSK